MPRTSGKKTAEPASTPVPVAFQPVVAAFSRDGSVTCDKGWGAGNVVLKVKGRIFVMLHKRDLVAKLSRSRVDELVAAGAGVRFDPRGDGREMREWIVISDDEPSRMDLAREAYGFVKASGGARATGRRAGGPRKKK